MHIYGPTAPTGITLTQCIVVTTGSGAGDGTLDKAMFCHLSVVRRGVHVHATCPRPLPLETPTPDPRLTAPRGKEHLPDPSRSRPAIAAAPQVL
jgi:hypothetical protein